MTLFRTLLRDNDAYSLMSYSFLYHRQQVRMEFYPFVPSEFYNRFFHPAHPPQHENRLTVICPIRRLHNPSGHPMKQVLFSPEQEQAMLEMHLYILPTEMQQTAPLFPQYHGVSRQVDVLYRPRRYMLNQTCRLLDNLAVQLIGFHLFRVPFSPEHPVLDHKRQPLLPLRYIQVPFHPWFLSKFFALFP